MIALPPFAKWRLLSRAAQSYPDVTPEAVPMVGRVISIILSLVTLAIIAVGLSRRIPVYRRWKTLPIPAWIVIVTYVDSFLFVFLSAIIKDLGVNNSVTLCQAAILLCLACYLTTKILIYLFLVERAHIVRGSSKLRRNDKVYLFNCFGLLIPYLAIAILNFVLRIGYINENGRCIIGMEKPALIPLISFDVVVNVYLTILFLVPLRQLYSYQNNSNPQLRIMAIRTFIGTCCTLLSSVINLTILTVLDGEPGWICLLACNADVLFSILVLHWITSTDKKDLEISSFHNSRSQSKMPPGNRQSINHTSSRAEFNDKNRAIISTKVGAETPKKHSQDSESYPRDIIQVRHDYTQEVEMDALSSESTTWTERAHKADTRSGSTDAIVEGV